MTTLLLDRPTTGDPILLHAFARRGRPLTVSDLLRAMSGTGARVSDVMELLAQGVAGGLLTPHGYRRDDYGRAIGALLYDLTDAGWDLVEADRLAA